MIKEISILYELGVEDYEIEYLISQKMKNKRRAKFLEYQSRD